MKSNVGRLCGLAILLSLVAGTKALAQQAEATSVLTLPISGTFAKDGTFAGIAAINRFEARGNNIVAIGFVRGTLSSKHGPIGTAVAGEIEWAVAVRAGVLTGVSGRAPSASRLRPIVLTEKMPSRSSGIVRTQGTGECGVLEIVLGPTDVNLLGIDVALTGMSLNLTGQTGPLGALVCAASDLLGNVAGLVTLLSNLLGLVTGLLGGLTGGLVPGV